MENKEKYYTPSIEEFFIGFEFEEEFKNYHWSKMIKAKSDVYSFEKLKLDTSHSISRIISKIKQNRVRVKYLDSEDLKEIGFQIHPTSYSAVYKKDDILISFSWDMKKIQISRIVMTQPDDFECSYEFSGREEKIFLGIIKNKSELQRLLKQLEI